MIKIKHKLKEEKPVDLVKLYDNLQDLLNNKSAIVYHGSTSYFKKFDIDKSRSDLNKLFYGNALFFTPSKDIAWDYASANRNIGVSYDVISNLKSKNREAGNFLEDLYKYGDDAWTLPKYTNSDGTTKISKGFNGIEPNDLNFLAEWIIGSKIKPIIDVFNIFNPKVYTPPGIFKLLKELKIDSAFIPYPRVYTVEIKPTKKVMVSTKPSALEKQNDVIIYVGEHAIKNIPEIAVYNENLIRIIKIEENKNVWTND